MKCFTLSVLSVVVALAFCTSCAPTPTRYHPLDYTGGYQDFPVTAEEFIVEFRGNEVTDPGTVKDYAFYRCAEMAKEKGFEEFEVVGMLAAFFSAAWSSSSEQFSKLGAIRRMFTECHRNVQCANPHARILCEVICENCSSKPAINIHNYIFNNILCIL